MLVTKKALLALEDGTLWPGRAFGASGETTGEIVFNTGMTGYGEILTDPSYHRQLVVLAAPHIGNYGVVLEDEESDRVWAAGLVIRALSPVVTNWRPAGDLHSYLSERGVVAITEVETRALVSHIRRYGAQRAALSSTDTDPERLVAAARAAPDMNGLDLATEVSCAEAYHWPADGGNGRFHVVVYDFGVKRNILRQLAQRGCRLTVVPATTTAEATLALRPDGVLLANGPGDPAAADYAINATRQLLGRKPIFGICMGHQILGLALGGRTYKLKFGHRGANQPVRDASGRVQISSHNHGFAVDATSLPPGVTITHTNLNDGCCEGLVAAEQQAFSVQYHPESAPGPHDSTALFDRFLALMADAAGD
jgi:carbamoyl-phosphate synthase small subunit